MNKRKLFRILKVTLLLYGIIGIALHALQDKILFHPKSLNTDYTFSFKEPFQEIFIAENESDTIHMVHFQSTSSLRKGDILYFHGNRNNLEYYYNRVPVFLNAGYDVWMPDYPGFGKSRGECSEMALYRQALLVHQYVTNQSKNNQIIVYGRSLGTAMASYVAAETQVKQLILETPYSSIPSLFGKYAFIYPVKMMCDYQLSNYDNVQRVQESVTIFHGTDDGVIPFREAKRLKKVLKPGDIFVEIENGSHNDIDGFPLYKKTLDSLLR